MKLSILCILIAALACASAHPAPPRRKCRSMQNGGKSRPPTAPEPANLGYATGSIAIPTASGDYNQSSQHDRRNDSGPLYGVSPNYKPDRPSYPWEDDSQPGVQPGFEPVVHLPVYGVGYGKRPRVPMPTIAPGNNDTSIHPPATNTTWSIGTPYTGAPNQPYVPGFGGEDLIKKPLPMDSKPFNLTLIHTNDIHARFDQFSRSGIDCTAIDIANKTCYGGIARIKTVVDKIRATESNVYMLDAGDQFQGTMFYSYYKGNVTAEYMNSIVYDAFSIGNHEFDDGPTHLAKFIRKLHVPALSSNIDTTAEPAMDGLVAPFVVLTKYEARIGIVGYITSTAPDITATGPNLRFTDPIGPVQRAVDQLHKLGVKRVICVSHNGYLDDQRVARGTKGVSLIVGGHSHSLLHNDNITFPQAAGPYPTAVKNLDGETTYIVQAKMWGEWVGHINMGWDTNHKLSHINGEPIRLTMDIVQHKETQAIVNKWREPFDAMAKIIIGTSPVGLPNGAPCKARGCGLGYLMAESLRQSYTGSLGRNKTVIGFIQDGGLRAGLPQGDVTVGNVLSIQPFSNSQVEMPITGTALVDMLENCAAGSHKYNGRAVTAFCQYSGVRAKADRSKPVFQRVSNVQIRDNTGTWAPLDLKAEYAMVCSDFIATGGDNIVPQANRSLLVRQLLSDVLLDYVKKVKTVVVPDEVGFQLIN